MKYQILRTSKFKKDLKTAIKREYKIELLQEIVDKLSKGEKLPEKNREHNLSGEYKGCKECHITPDWLLIYKIEKDKLVLMLTRTGTHSDLFKSN
ncbi:MAG: type II toxin-antitoxin system YafQ family toxin [Oscillospiraceae bacterium]|nr:type II toxin-antitoxin system YafQ family toxin [Oscillospiraceae bacterium]